MTPALFTSVARSPSRAALLVLGLATAVALFGALPYAGSWNDGSRLATVEALVDHHTLAIDDSIFVKVPAGDDTSRPTPYRKQDTHLMKGGTGDKLYINGHFYSDKSPVPALLMAGAYRVWQDVTGWTARDHADSFCYFLTVLTSGAAYVAAVWCLFRCGPLLGLPLPWTLALTASFALSTVALAYSRHVNNHIELLAVTAALMLGLLRLARDGREGRVSWWRLLGLGTLAGLGYTIDLGAGPVILVCTLGVVLYRCWRPAPVLAFLLAAAPWLALHHIVNYAVGGTWKPANAVPEYFNWPGCVFNAQNMTGAWNHYSIPHFLVYAAALLLGKQGFFWHNLPLFLALPAILVLLARRTPELPEVLFTGFCCGGIWLAYALTSTNYSGSCCSIRWFVPLLAPAYVVLGVFLRQYPRYRADFLILSGWGAVIALICWIAGPWTKHLVPLYWPIQIPALLTWAWYVRRRRRRDAAAPAPAADRPGACPEAA